MEGIAVTHLTVTDALVRFAAAQEWRRLLPAMTRGETWGAAALGGEIGATRDGDGWILNGRSGLVDNAERAGIILVLAHHGDGRPLLAVVPRGISSLAVEPAPATLGARGLGAGHLVCSGVRVTDAAVAMARLAATEAASRVTLEAMRIHGGYGYTTDFAVERYYRDAPRLVLALGGNDRERDDLGRTLAATTEARE